MASKNKCQSTATTETLTKTPSVSRKMLMDDKIAQNVIFTITMAINERTDGLQASINELKDIVEYVQLSCERKNGKKKVQKDLKLNEIENKI